MGSFYPCPTPKTPRFQVGRVQRRPGATWSTFLSLQAKRTSAKSLCSVNQNMREGGLKHSVRETQGEAETEAEGDRWGWEGGAEKEGVSDKTLRRKLGQY